MKPYTITAHQKEGLTDVAYPDINRRIRTAYTAPTPTMGYNGDSTRALQPVYFADDEIMAMHVAQGLALRWPNYQFQVSKVTAIVEMPPLPVNVRPDVKQLSEKGLLP